MRNFASAVLILALSLFVTSCATFQMSDKTEEVAPQDAVTPSERPQSDAIDIYAEDAGEFLDIDIAELEKKAREAYNNGDYEVAARDYLAYLQYNTQDGGNIYNLACCYGLLGEAELACRFLERAFEAGFRDVGWAANDPDFNKVKDTEHFKTTIQKLEQTLKEADADKGEETYLTARSEFRCRIRLPEGYDKDKAYPLIVALHGFGSDPESFVRLYDRFENPQFIYAAPQAMYPYLRGNEQGYSWTAPLPHEDPVHKRSWSESEDYVAGLVRHLKKMYNVSEVYLLGFSQGCGLAYTAGIKNHELFKGLICFGGWFSEDWLVDEAGIDLGKMNHLRVFIGHGNKDEMVKIEEGTKAKDILEKNGYEVTFYEFDGPHAVPAEALLEVQKWMSQ